MTVSGYTGRQVGLHWMIAILIGAQFLLHDGVEASWRAIRDGGDAGFSLLTLSHILFGILVLLLALPRVWLRLSRGAPPLPENEPPILAKLAGATHLVLYAAILLMPLSGMAAWFGQVGAAAIGHSLMSNLLMLFVLLHIAGALYQHFVLRSDVLRRMTRPTE